MSALWCCIGTLTSKAPFLLSPRAHVLGKRCECCQVRRKRRSGLMDDRTDEASNIGRQILGQRVVCPVAAPIGNNQPAGNQELEVPRDVCLGLTKRLSEFADAQIPLREQRNDAGACGISQGPCYCDDVNCIGHIRYRLCALCCLSTVTFIGDGSILQPMLQRPALLLTIGCPCIGYQLRLYQFELRYGRTGSCVQQGEDGYRLGR